MILCIESIFTGLECVYEGLTGVHKSAYELSSCILASRVENVIDRG